MHNEEEIKSILLNLLRTGLLRIRVAGWDGRAEQCALEADHLHNVPDIARKANVDSLSCYYNAERPDFLRKAINPEAFAADWKRLGEILADIELDNTKITGRTAGDS
jgi:hypothetical protein